ncbi:glycosyltransferase family 4 protein [Novosphingobium sp. Chol11]|uniref:glycosyltransferase family 4 protein n=1 Tax=Novosphingobium sp. Chol11 TaxID=1385763 RepID=UPI00114236D9|nr:glycosyltransferase family 1 protein [Novosphingobium sp. Chol11]
MRVLVDGLNIALPKGTGIATYARNFITQAARCGHDIDILLGNNWETSIPRGDHPTLAQALQRTERGKRPFRAIRRYCGAISNILYPRLNRIPLAEDTSGLPVQNAWYRRELFANAATAFRRFGRFTEIDVPGIDLAHWTCPVPLRVKTARNIYTIHDLVPLIRPELVVGDRAQMNLLIGEIMANADRILTVSECSRSDIIDHMSVDPAFVVNTYQSLEEVFWSEPQEVSPRNLPAGLTNGGYFLFFGAVEPKKNVERIIEAHRDARINLPLVLVASPGWASDDLWEEIRRYSAGGKRCVLLQHLPRKELMALIQSARSVIFPSLYEGFGLPALEAMALGTPVIGSTAGSLPEVIGNGGLLVDPVSVADLTDAMLKLERSDYLAAVLAANGLEQAARFSPDAYRKKIEVLLATLGKNKKEG